ncbi:MAG: TerB family tellurite resistance protein [Nitratireductor sp.]|jgi:DnaJ like chaperone protein|nr:TerB family tellurite resistance protein [Nitratireductor sp.]
MTVWSRISDFISSATVDAFSGVVERVRTVFEGDPHTRRQVAFSIALIALSAKMAKADGVVTRVEVDAFRDIFAIPAPEAANVGRLYNLAKQDVAGFGAYARRIRELFPGDDAILVDVMDGLFHIAKSDGMVHEKEMEFIDRVAQVFKIEGPAYERIRLRHLSSLDGNPYELMGASPEWDNDTLKSFYRKLVQENHPDRMVARGVPEEFVALANSRLSVINTAWASIRKERGI